MTPDVSAAADPARRLPRRLRSPVGAGDPSSAPAGGLPADRPQPAGASAVSLRGVGKVYGTARNAVVALERIDLDVAPGEFVCVVGASGCGKSHPAQPGGRARLPHGGHGGRRGPHRAHVPGRRPVPVADRGGERRPGAQAAQGPQGRAPRPGGRAARPGRPHDVRQAPAPRAVGRHAPAGRPGPGLRPGRRRPPHGRALRGARRHDPRRDARRAREPVADAAPHRPVRHPQRARGRPPGRPHRRGHQPARAGPLGRRGRRRPAPPHRVAPGGRHRHPGDRPAAPGGAPPCRLR